MWILNRGHIFELVAGELRTTGGQEPIGSVNLVLFPRRIFKIRVIHLGATKKQTSRAEL